METAEKRIEFIEEMINSAKGNISEGSIFYLIWGWSVLTAALSNYILLNHIEYEFNWIGWPILMTLAAILSLIVGYKKGNSKNTSSYLEKLMGYLWLSFVITLFVFLFGMSVLGHEAIYPIIMALYGLGTFASGGMLQFKPLMIGGISSWVCAIIAFQVGFSDQLILISVAIVTSYIIPGHLLAAKNRRNV